MYCDRRTCANSGYQAIFFFFASGLGTRLVYVHSGGVWVYLGIIIRESVDSLCRDGADAQYMQYFNKQKPYNSTTNTLKAYLSAHSSSLSAFMISKTRIVAQKPRGRQLNAKVCSSKSAIFLILSLFRPLVKQQ